MFVEKRRRARAVLACVWALLAWSSWPGMGSAQEGSTLDEVLEMAKARAPAILASRADIDAAEGRMLTASRVVQTNPVLSGGFGHRAPDAEPDTREARVSLQQDFEVGSKRRARKAVAEADLARSGFASAESTRRLLRDVALAFLDGLYAQRRLQQGQALEALHAEVLQVTERRHAAGELARLDVGLAAAALSKARADVRSFEAAHGLALARLRLLVGLAVHESLALRGDLRDLPDFAGADLGARAAARPDVLAAEAELRERQAQGDVARKARLPDLGVGGVFERHENANIGLAMLSLSLPVFARGQGEAAEATARGRAAEINLQAARNGSAVELQAALAAYDARVAAVLELEGHALPLLDENEQQLRRGYGLGEVPLVQLLAARREIADIRVTYLDQLLSAAQAAIEVRAAADLLETGSSGPLLDSPRPSTKGDKP